MRAVAVICECNPLHNGHAYLFSEAKRRTDADFLIAVMSGNFVQRGEPAILDKFTRAGLVLEAGADAVFELPPVFAMSSAREFALAGVKTALCTGVADALSFGVEPGIMLSELQAAADFLAGEEPEAFSEALRKGLKDGLSYPAARAAALSETGSPSLRKTLESPNSILAVEYLRALRLCGSAMDTAAVTRRGAGYHDASIAVDTEVPASATALRQLLLPLRGGQRTEAEKEALLRTLSCCCPRAALPVYEAALSRLVSPEDISLILNERILHTAFLKESADLAASGHVSAPDFPDFTIYADVSKALSDRLLRTAGRLTGFQGRVESLKTKQYTELRIRRALLHIALGLTAAETELRKKSGYVSYLRLLGFRRDAAGLLRAVKRHAAVPVVTKPADEKALIAEDVRFDQLYYALTARGFGPVPNEYERSPVII